MMAYEDQMFEDDGRDGLEGQAADTSALIRCPYCGEEVEITLDPGGGTDQEYVEDCEVCCRPWQLHVTFDLDGAADVQVDAAG